MPREGQKTVTIGGKTLKILERFYKKELIKSLYHISFAEFITKHAIRDIEREGGQEIGRAI
jgi:hypothetical protein